MRIAFLTLALMLLANAGAATDWTTDCRPEQGCVFSFRSNKIGDDISLRAKDFKNGRYPGA